MRTNKSMSTKAVVLLLTVVLLIGCAVGGTLAWLTQKTTTVTNTFTAGNIDITLEETTGASYKMVPGNDIAKNPTVSVVAGSEACWLFVQVETNDLVASYLTYSIDSRWTKLEGVAGVDNVYYIEVSAADAAAGVSYPVLTDNKVTVKTTVTKAMMDAIEGTSTKPVISFTAYAVQRDNIATAAAAWGETP